VVIELTRKEKGNMKQQKEKLQPKDHCPTCKAGRPPKQCIGWPFCDKGEDCAEHKDENQK